MSLDLDALERDLDESDDMNWLLDRGIVDNLIAELRASRKVVTTAWAAMRTGWPDEALGILEDALAELSSINVSRGSK